MRIAQRILESNSPREVVGLIDSRKITELYFSEASYRQLKAVLESNRCDGRQALYVALTVALFVSLCYSNR